MNEQNGVPANRRGDHGPRGPLVRVRRAGNRVGRHRATAGQPDALRCVAAAPVGRLSDGRGIWFTTTRKPEP